MNDLSSESARTEEARIRAVYVKRHRDDARYSWFSPGHLYIIQKRERRFLALLKRYNFAPLDTKKILELGCGTGYWLREFIRWGARPESIVGVDLLPDRVAEAKNCVLKRRKFTVEVRHDSHFLMRLSIWSFSPQSSPQCWPPT